MPDWTIRPFRSMADAAPQYALWLEATAHLPRAWRSCLRNVEHQLAQAAAAPGCRLYAERPDGSLAGYIGVHPPFEWSPAAHGPPSEPLGWAIPFGFPWTFPRDPSLEVVLYDEMARSIPETFAASRRDIYIQRFRETWTEHIGFLTARGWRQLKRVPLLGDAAEVRRAPPELSPVHMSELQSIADLAASDPTATDVTAEQLRARCEGGWLDPDAFWRLGDRGAFALEPRGRHAAVTAFFATPEGWDDTLAAASAHAAALGARELYFTVEPHEQPLRDALAARGYTEVDAGVYYARDAD